MQKKAAKHNLKANNPTQQQISTLLEHHQNGRFSDAEKLAVHITQDFPKHPLAWKVLGAVLEATGRKSEAVDANQKAVALSPQDAEAHNNLGITLKVLGRLDEAEASYNQAIALKPDLAEAHSNLGTTLKELGRLDEAEASYNQAIALKPDLADAHRNLTLMKKFDAQDEQYSIMQDLYLDKNISEEQRCHINFGLAKACEDLGDFEQAFAH